MQAQRLQMLINSTPCQYAALFSAIQNKIDSNQLMLPPSYKPKLLHPRQVLVEVSRVMQASGHLINETVKALVPDAKRRAEARVLHQSGSEIPRLLVRYGLCRQLGLFSLLMGHDGVRLL